MANKKRPDLIDRKALGIGYCNPLVFDKTEYAHGWNSAIEILMKAPTVDAVEVVHGWWENITDYGGGNCFGYCSNCKTPIKSNNRTALIMDNVYCRYCGAKMDGDGNG